MASSLSAYWVKFFKGAGFPQDVATKHAVVFSNNRIKPDMLPDLDKPSLKEMGITLMGDMIAILRYAKKVVEETTCERFLVDTEDNVGTPKPIVQKVAIKAPTKAITSKLKSDAVTTKKVIKVPTSSIKKAVTVKKLVSTSNEIITNLANQKKQTILKRKLEDDEFDSNNDDQWKESPKKVKSLDNKDDKVGYTVILPKGSTSRSQQILKKSAEQKRTVFDRLGDSSVTSTTNPAETSPTFNITGLGKDVFKRSVSVFNRLGDKDAKKDNSTQVSILKNGTNSTGILKTKSANTRTSILTTNKIVSKNVGTMRADQEASRKVMSNNVTQLVKTTKRISFNNTPSRDNRIQTNISSGKLASERLTSIPAKARLGVIKTNGAKQVTFDRVTTIAHVKKPDVFSRLGI
ncbi:Uncharacterized protein C19orf47 like protein [Habropoda laboriosa]|uniref:Uncharacterized protein C19orf47 like protein n=1 Tax=Habropoda laboriosa TaxID=597456 RepID=A0A0L7QV42_9HYME|nr:PREDICTED: uncharacterized protein C19orf47 [Habropoda laboriosa]KOC62527.1 Uncharacterized protein C19orf47 like protein [Habropoda laboriosa]